MNWSAHVAMNCLLKWLNELTDPVVRCCYRTDGAGRNSGGARDRRDIGAWVRTDKWWRTAATAGGGGSGQAAGAWAAGGR